MKLPKDANVGDKFEIPTMVRGKKRFLTYKKTEPRGRNKNLSWKITRNESPEEREKRVSRKKQKKNK